MEDTIKQLTLSSFHDGLRKKKFSATEITKALFEYIDVEDKDINAYLSLHQETAFAQAAEVDVAIMQDKAFGILAGAPVAVKDNILIKGTKTTAASKILENYISAYDASVIEKLKAEQAIFIGKTNLDEFAMGSSTENSAYGPTRNPHDRTRVPGGSSGGSAAAVASGMALAALGSDTGGSIRQPAAFCGVVGLKPTYGAVSRYGVISMASSLDQIGPLTKTVEDAELMFQAIAGRDPHDATSVEYSYKKITPQKTSSLVIGIPDEYFVDGLDSEIANEIQNVAETFKKQGITIKRVSLPHTKYALSAYYIVMPAEVSTNLARFDGIRYAERRTGENLWDIYDETKGAGFGPETKRRIILGAFVLSAGHYDAYYAKAQKVRRLIAQDFDQAFNDVDVILSPVTPTLPFKIGENINDPLKMYLSDIFTITVNLAGLPALVVPAKGRKGKLPIGFQLIGQKWKEADILGLGKLYELL
ncbi:MAG: Asp-tRNA(Asn)/Glu-tRNA(Gln) amidotransferase subunit GatA [bacterium]